MSQVNVCVKLYTEPEGEVRHFCSPTSDYAAFEKRVRELIGFDNFRLFAKDSEGELAVVGSDRELQLARHAQLYTAKEPYLRIYLRSAKNLSQPDQNKTVHVNVSCTSCMGEVAGTRYKCLKCPNYDLCEKCMGNGTHCEHDMLAARSPRSQELMKLAQGPREDTLEGSSARVDTTKVVAEKPQSFPNDQVHGPLLTKKEMDDGFDILRMCGSRESHILEDLCRKFNDDTQRVLHFLELVSRVKNL